ncbi:MAG TPA: hypothetical protein VNG13_07840 [Mycobacteriales bacterium]|nr:hypothetical protein [Mycobacteriales bacterium]
MPAIQILSISEPLSVDPAVGSAAARLISRIHYFGLLPGLEGPLELDRALLLLAFTKLSEAGVGQKSRLLLQRASGPDDYLTLLDAALEQTEQSPLPTSEWAPLIETLGEGLLADLVGISPSSLRRYATGTRTTPDQVATQLHYLALLIADLSGAYNDYGIRRWFDRPRARLDGRSPRDLLGTSFDADSGDTQRLRDLAAGLVGAGAT